MNARKIIKFSFYISIVILALKSAQVAYDRYFSTDENYSVEPAHVLNLDIKNINIPTAAIETDGSVYDFKRMLELIEVCEKIKYLDYLRYSRPKETPQINPDTLQSLIGAMQDEKSKLKHHIAQIKAGSRDSVPSRRMKALKYYFRVVEINLQDLKGIAANKGIVCNKK